MLSHHCAVNRGSLCRRVSTFHNGHGTMGINFHFDQGRKKKAEFNYDYFYRSLSPFYPFFLQIEHLDFVAKDKCDMMANSKPTHVYGVAVPVMSSVSISDPVFQACSMLNTGDFCEIQIDVLGPKLVSGLCTLDFHGKSTSTGVSTQRCVCVGIVRSRTALLKVMDGFLI